MAQVKRRCPGCSKKKELNEKNWCQCREGWRSLCRECYNKARREGRSTDPDMQVNPKELAQTIARNRRLNSDFEQMKPEDWDTSVANNRKIDPEAAKTKRQEFSLAMGEFSTALSKSQGNPEALPSDLGTYIGRLAEQERRFGNRRVARSISLIAAHEELNRRLIKQVAENFFHDKITPTGYALRDHTRPIKRAVVALFSDLHLGADIGPVDNPIPYRAIEEARRLEFFTHQILNYKVQYRENSELVLLLNGDLIEGLLLHDLRDGIPLVEQKAVFWHYFRQILALCSQQFPKVRVICQPGNHGRDKIRHAGRATSSKWDGHEWEMMYALAQMCAGLRNVSFDNTRQAYSAVQLFDSWMLVSHGDTEIKLGDPDTKFKENAAELDHINSKRIYGHEFAVFAGGHFHKGRFQPHGPDMIWNGALVPSNGHARASGYNKEPCGQWLWEAVEGHPVGDLRFIKVGPAQDRDEKLGSLVTPFRFEQGW